MPTRNLSISIVIPTFNRAHLIGRAVASAIQELEPGDEVIVIDDGSTDNTDLVMKTLAHSQLRYVRQTNSGAGSARNHGAAIAANDLVAFLDSDDEWLPGTLSVRRRYMAARPGVLFSFTDFVGVFGGEVHSNFLQKWHTDKRSWEEIFGPGSRFSTIAELPGGTADFMTYSGNIYRNELHTNYINTSTVLIRRQEAADSIHFTEGVATFEDWECWGRLSRQGVGGYLAIETAIQHGHSGPRLTDAGLLTCSECRLKILQAVWGSDPDFLDEFGEEYEAVVMDQRANRVRALLGMGRLNEAREELDDLSSAPFIYRALSRLPVRLVIRLVEAHRSFNRWRELRMIRHKKGSLRWA